MYKILSPRKYYFEETASGDHLLLSLLLLLLLRQHHHHLTLHHHFILNRARHSNEGERHLNLADFGFGQHLLSNVERCREADLLVQEDAASTWHPGAEHGRDQAVDEDAVHDRYLKRSGAGVRRIQVEGVGVTRQLSERLHVTGGERFGEGSSLANVEWPAEVRSHCDGRQRFIKDSPPQETHCGKQKAPPASVEL